MKNRKIRTYEFLLPTRLASYLVNCDSSGIEKNEIDEIEKFLKGKRLYCVAVNDDHAFYWRNDLNSLGADCSTFVFHKIPYQRLIDKIITKVNIKYGAPMGRRDVGTMPTDEKIYDCFIPMTGGYDRGGAYWGLPNTVRVKYTKDLSYIEFYRPG